MMSIGVVSYATGGGLFLLLALTLLRRPHACRRMLIVASLSTVAWSAGAAWYSAVGHSASVPQLLEFVRDLAWLALLGLLLSGAYEERRRGGLLQRALFGLSGFVVLLMGLVFYQHFAGPVAPVFGEVDLLIAGNLLLAVAGLVLVEQLFRNTLPDVRRALKYICMGLGAMFAYDFYLYADALLFQRIDPALWHARGFIIAMVVPVLAVGLARETGNPRDVFVSRRIVFHTTALLGAGLYLLAMGLGGYYVRVYGGSWGVVAQAIFLFGAALVLAILLFSGQLRATLRVLISKHFFRYKYDYREEWLRFIWTISSNGGESDLRARVLRAVAQIIESPGGTLWLRRESGRYEPCARWNSNDELPVGEPANSSLVEFLTQRGWVINLEQYERTPECYADLVLPDWLRHMRNAWLVVPLILHDALLGFIVVSRSPLRRHFNWEDCDLLKTAACQAASHLAQHEASQALADARQFEACNRLSAYVVHDLKNLIAQLSLVVNNAARHRHNEAFVEDALRTVDNSVAKMNRLLGHLRSGGALGEQVQPVELAQLLSEVTSGKVAGRPAPTFESGGVTVWVRADRERLATVLGHVVQNAQDATPDAGRVHVRLTRSGNTAVVDVEDTGCGMDEQFIRERLFRPFDTTKGAAGMGIGAYEARELVRALGGDVQVTSRPGEGTLFRIYLPICEGHETDGSTQQDERTTRYAEAETVKEIAGCGG